MTNHAFADPIHGADRIASNEARRSQLDRYLITISELEEVIQEEFDIPATLKNIEHDESWERSNYCDLS